ncbi:hypothetical protein [Legionella sp. CNM-4043-24]|uniref:hypothetical protein n=1 Tax=Legionella sp. CNM-4043-24 TaxID=3421646 RepID=UPI00403AEF1E
MKFNPFSFLFESPDSPHARSLRTTFSEKWMDAFRVFYGDARARRAEPRMGIYDWLTLFIPAGLNRMEVYLEQTPDSSFSFMYKPLQLLNNALTVPKAMVSIIAAIVTTPVILITAGVVRAIDGDGRERLLEIVGKQEPAGPVYQLSALLSQPDIDLECLKCEVKGNEQITLRAYGPMGLEGRRMYDFFLPATPANMALLTRYNVGGINNIATSSEETPLMSP